MCNIDISTCPHRGLCIIAYGMKHFELSPKQKQAQTLMAGDATHILLRGGARSGKTFVIMKAIATRAIRAPSSRHGCFRQRFNHIKTSIISDTFPKMMKLCYPSVGYHINRSDWYATIESNNGGEAEIWFGGLDEGDRTEKVLGMEFATIFMNECSQISYGARNKLVTRLAQNIEDLKLRAYYDCNPPNMGHWLYAMFGLKLEPISRAALDDPDNYVTMQINPVDNPNLPPEVLKNLMALPLKDRMRFMDGEFLPMVDGALWTYDLLELNRVDRKDLPEMERIVIGVDPSGASGAADDKSDEIGIVAAGLGRDGKGYILEDASGQMGPVKWAETTINLYNKWGADRIVAEKNYGGALVEANIRSVNKMVAVKMVTATRGKVIRAEPISALYEQNIVKHLNGQDFAILEEQLCNFSTSGYQGLKSPDHADAAIWALTDLMIDPSQGYDLIAAMGG